MKKKHLLMFLPPCFSVGAREIETHGRFITVANDVVDCHGDDAADAGYDVECDAFCTSGCNTQGKNKCDSACATGYSLTAEYTCIGQCLLSDSYGHWKSNRRRFTSVAETLLAAHWNFCLLTQFY